MRPESSTIKAQPTTPNNRHLQVRSVLGEIDGCVSKRGVEGSAIGGGARSTRMLIGKFIATRLSLPAVTRYLLACLSQLRELPDACNESPLLVDLLCDHICPLPSSPTSTNALLAPVSVQQPPTRLHRSP